MTKLFDSIKVGAYTFKNRVFMAPLTRGRAGESRVPNALMAEYYAQRADAGLIISEATAISKQGYGWRDAPGMYTDEQEAGWKQVTEAVHKEGGRIFLQLWHMGRVSHPFFQDNNELPVAPSAIIAEGSNRSLPDKGEYVVPRALTVEEIKQTVKDYATATERALRAGFDGVEIHGANGYLIDQFIHDGSNVRTDEYGGSIENRTRFLREVVEAVVAVAGAERTGLRLSPVNGYNSMQDGTLEKTFVSAAEQLNKYNLAYLHLKEPSRNAQGQPVVPAVTKAMRAVYKGLIVVNDGYDAGTAQEALESGLADAVAFGTPFLANPDLVDRLRDHAPLNTPDVTTFYKGGAEGYTDYPFMPGLKTRSVG